MGAFTTINAGTDWQAASVMKEIQLGIIERRQAVGYFSFWAPSTIYPKYTLRLHPTTYILYYCTEAHTSGSTWDATKWADWSEMEGRDLQGLDYVLFYSGGVEWAGWSRVQKWLEEVCIDFIDHSVDLTTVGEPPRYTLASWRSAAGINPSGFRRSTTDPVSGALYGRMQEGDVIGSWIFDEIQAGLSVLKKTRVGLSSQTTTLDSGAQLSAASLVFNTCANAKNSYDSQWPPAWNNTTFPYYRASYNTTYIPASSFWNFGGYRNRSKPKINTSLGLKLTPFKHQADCWLLAGWDAFGIDVFLDIDGISNGNGLLWNLEHFANSNDTSHVTAYVGDTTLDPNPDSCPVVAQGATHGMFANYAWWVIEWDFTNSN